jgi:hypothetical protein
MTDPNDKYAKWKVDFHANESHEEHEVEESEGNVNDWHSRHRDKLLDDFCDTHPGAPQCKVFDE